MLLLQTNMKILSSIALMAFLLVSCRNNGGNALEGAVAAAKDTARYTTIQWIDSIKDIGNVKFGDTATIQFKFKNTGALPLFVINVEPGCGCTVADYPKMPVAPGKEGIITAAFDSNKGHEGDFRKNINVTTNTIGSTSHVLFFRGVIEKEQGAVSAPGNMN